MGLIDQLKEQRRCKIVLILNDASLKEVSSVDYARLREKVIDRELKFAPMAADCTLLALRKDQFSKLLRDNLLKLNINNIRIIKKIEKLAFLLTPKLAL
ncbi:hypothetical protein [Malonomonas rubra]|uniref:hypothetical protein n=1 Tax=Malonomonas rubra TaxID=57040 RepID=UPI0026EE1F2E|nr:hypothetical protein [Malonomonas rubra]